MLVVSAKMPRLLLLIEVKRGSCRELSIPRRFHGKNKKDAIAIAMRFKGSAARVNWRLWITRR
jgi:hypothetical protein